MLRTIRLTTAIVCFTLITLLFLDFTGTLHKLINFQFIVVISKCLKLSGLNHLYFNFAKLIREICFSTIQITECFTNFTDNRRENL